jgi:hypothetical protein
MKRCTFCEMPKLTNFAHISAINAVTIAIAYHLNNNLIQTSFKFECRLQNLKQNRWCNEIKIGISCIKEYEQKLVGSKSG